MFEVADFKRNQLRPMMFAATLAKSAGDALGKFDESGERRLQLGEHRVRFWVKVLHPGDGWFKRLFHLTG